jgi:hypothetical protein
MVFCFLNSELPSKKEDVRQWKMVFRMEDVMKLRDEKWLQSAKMIGKEGVTWSCTLLLNVFPVIVSEWQVVEELLLAYVSGSSVKY